MAHRTGPDTCCWKCSRKPKCVVTKTRYPCIFVHGGPACLSSLKGHDKFCTVCDLFEGVKADPDQAKLPGMMEEKEHDKDEF